MMIIRQAESEELEHVLKLSEKFYWESPYALLAPFDPVSTQGLIDRIFEQGMMFVALTEEGTDPVGFACGLLAPMTINNQYLTGVEIAWYVMPQHRSAGLGRQLHQALEEQARELGARMWSMAIMCESSPPESEKVLRESGYRKTEHTWTKIFPTEEES